MTLQENQIIPWNSKRDLIVPGMKDATILFAKNHWLHLAKESISQSGRFNVALSGGSTPKAIFESISKEKEFSFDWKDVYLYWSDERCVPPDSNESNFKMAMDSGLSLLPLKKEHIFRMKGEEDPEIAARDYEKILEETLPHLQFDLVMLGMGEDGHTASLFPETHALHVEEKMVTSNFVPKLHTWRLSLTFFAINRAKHVAIYVLGENKAEILHQVLNSKLDINKYPIQNVGSPSTRALWILDREAASELRMGKNQP